MKRWFLLLPLLAACSAPAPYATTVGLLKPGATMTVLVDGTTLGAYPPSNGQPRDLFTVAATARSKASPPPPPHQRAAMGNLTVTAPPGLDSLLLRVPDGVDLTVHSLSGDVSIADITGNVRVVALHGNVTVVIPGYAQAAVGEGSITATMGSQSWPGTLRFSTAHGDVTIRLGANVAFRVHAHTGAGTIFNDFGLPGQARGGAQNVSGVVNGGGAHAIDVEVTAGNVRLLHLQPQS